VTTTPQLRPVSATERVPPASMDAERSVIGAALILREVPAEAAELQVDDFYLPAHRVIWEAIIGLAKRQRAIDPVALADELKISGDLLRIEGGSSYLVECASAIPVVTEVGQYVRIVREKSSLRALITICAEVSSRAYGDQAFEEIIAEARTQILNLESTGTLAEPEKIGDALVRVLDSIDERSKAPDTFAVQTGIRRFDRLTGGLREAKLIIVAARPGMGKTAWAGTVCTNAAMQYEVPAFIASVEMDRDELIERMLASEASVSTEAIATGAVAKTDQIANVHAAARRLSPIPLWIDDRGYVTAGQVCGAIRRWYAKTLGRVPAKGEPPKLAIAAIDYLQILEEDADDQRRARRDLALGKMTRALKQLAKSLRIPIVLLSQLNRKVTEGIGRRPQLSDLRESGAIEQDADIVIFPHRELPDDEAEAARMRNEPGDMEWVIGKNRGGRTGIVPVHWQPAYTRFENRVADEPTEHWQDGKQED
jgi:replicative DNA helicase